MTCGPNVTLIATSPALPTRRGGMLTRALAQVRIWIERSRQRHALAELDDRLLRDVGITRWHAKREAARSYWDY